jgi:hypothetical protein
MITDEDEVRFRKATMKLIEAFTAVGLKSDLRMASRGGGVELILKRTGGRIDLVARRNRDGQRPPLTLIGEAEASQVWQGQDENGSWRTMLYEPQEPTAGRDGAPRKKITRPPGHTIYSFLKTVYGARAYERVFEPGLQDMRQEHFLALEGGHFRLARWIAVRGHLILAMTIIAYLAGKFGRALWRGFKAS